MGFAVAVVVYSYQALGRQGVFSDDVAVASSFPATVNAGLASLFVVGAAIAHDWTGAAWLALFGAVLSCIWFAFLAQSFRDATRAASPDFRIGIRRRRLEQQARSLARDQASIQVASTILNQLLGPLGITNSVWVFPGTDDDEDRMVRASRSGKLNDIDLVGLERVVRRCNASGVTLDLSLRFGKPISAGTLLARGDGPLPTGVVGSLNNCLRIDQDRRQISVADGISQLRDEAVIGMGPTTSILDAVLAAYEALLGAYAASWHEYVDDLTADLIGDLFDFDAPITAMSRSLFEIMERALETNARDSALTVAYFPIRILRQAVVVRAPAFTQILDLYAQFYAATTRSPGRTDIRDLVRDRCWRHMIEARTYILPAAAAKQPAGARTPSYEAGLAALYGRLLSVLKLMIDANDKVNFGECLRTWQLHEAEDRQGSEAEDGHVHTSFIALGWVIARRYRVGALSDPHWWLRALAAKDDVDAVTSAVDLELATGSSAIDTWAALDLPSGEASFIDANSDLIRAWIYLLLLLSTGGQVQRFEIGSGLYQLRSQVYGLLDEAVKEAATLETDLLVSDVPACLAAIRSILGDAIGRRERVQRDEIRGLTIAPGLVAAFAAAVLASRDKGFPRNILESSGAVVRGEQPPSPIRPFGLATLEDKRIFVPFDGMEPDGASIGQVFGRSIARGELARILELLAKLPPRTWSLPTDSQRIARALERLQQAGQGASLVIVPSSWRIWRKLETEGHFVRRDPGDGPLGSFDGIDVYECQMPDEASAYVLSLPSAAGIRQFTQDGREIDSNIRPLNAAELAGVSAERLALVAPDLSEPDELRAGLLVRVESWEVIAIHVDRKAAIRVRLEPVEGLSAR